MPDLLIFAPCEKIIIDQQGNPTLISVMQKVTVQVPASVQEVPEGALSPKEWGIFALWRPRDGEHGKTFTQHTEVFLPSGKKSSDMKQVFTFKTHEAVSNVLNIRGLPIAEQGTLQVVISVNGENRKHIFDLYVEHTREEEPSGKAKS